MKYQTRMDLSTQKRTYSSSGNIKNNYKKVGVIIRMTERFRSQPWAVNLALESTPTTSLEHKSSSYFHLHLQQKENFGKKCSNSSKCALYHRNEHMSKICNHCELRSLRTRPTTQHTQYENRGLSKWCYLYSKTKTKNSFVPVLWVQATQQHCKGSQQNQILDWIKQEGKKSLRKQHRRNMASIFFFRDNSEQPHNNFWCCQQSD